MTRPVQDQSLSIITHGVPSFGKYHHQSRTAGTFRTQKRKVSPDLPEFDASPPRERSIGMYRSVPFFVGTGAKPLARSETKKTHAVPTPQGAFPSDHDWLSLLRTSGYGYQENRLT